MAEQTTSSGVQDLISRIRDEGVRSGRQEAERIVAEAKKEAARILAEAKERSDELDRKTRTETEAYRTSAIESLKLSARDTILQLKEQVAASFQKFVGRLVTSAMADKELIQAIVLVLAGHVADEFIKDKEVQILINDAILKGESDPKLRERGRQVMLSLTTEMLREGVELIPASDIHLGARVRLVKEKLEIDLSDKAIAQMLYQLTLPRFRDLLESIE
jgi:V/A-type H+-transporting ATPase subunit E